MSINEIKSKYFSYSLLEENIKNLTIEPDSFTTTEKYILEKNVLIEEILNPVNFKLFKKVHSILTKDFNYSSRSSLTTDENDYPLKNQLDFEQIFEMKLIIAIDNSETIMKQINNNNLIKNLFKDWFSNFSQDILELNNILITRPKLIFYLKNYFEQNEINFIVIFILKVKFFYVPSYSEITLFVIVLKRIYQQIFAQINILDSYDKYHNKEKNSINYLEDFIQKEHSSTDLIDILPDLHYYLQSIDMNGNSWINKIINFVLFFELESFEKRIFTHFSESKKSNQIICKIKFSKLIHLLILIPFSEELEKHHIKIVNRLTLIK